jgi:hypothetical protein
MPRGRDGTNELVAKPMTDRLRRDVAGVLARGLGTSQGSQNYRVYCGCDRVGIDRRLSEKKNRCAPPPSTMNYLTSALLVTRRSSGMVRACSSSSERD